MSNLKLIHHLGVFVQEDFLSVDQCINIVSELEKLEVTPVGVVGEDGLYQINQEVRKVHQIDASQSSIQLVQKKILTVKDKLEDYFSLQLDSNESLQVLRYKEGDFYLPHVDTNHGDHQPFHIKKRKTSVVIFLNNLYQGGALTFYGLIQKNNWKSYGFPVDGKPGLLLAFSSELIHEVEPVVQGTRYTIVSWFN
ncbi:2OG-Fe(II) oxygenase [Roseofilum sp. BLCC_M91]|uniref:2OG-Fe(II) oxygenase n=1 Tax=Roseofilum halophilum BLCC-M91 TaxID=3022259 RepID=A0ABT7BNZ2_9CYAN|nr:2OG-Fe(II) oxygenase [Roseofilum halophilum]MDJ1180897.1 2OG-Fe(II) oxygenase [Roseofilum halophilum BLCC-M91]